MKTYFLIFCLAVFSLPVVSQRNLDSLEKILKVTKEDSSRCKTLGEIISAVFESGNVEQMISYNNQLQALTLKYYNSLPFSDKMYRFYARHLADSYNNSAILSDNLGQMDTAMIYYEKTMQIAKKLKDGERECFTYGDMVAHYVMMDDTANALIYSKKNLDLALQIKHDEAIAYALNNMASLYMSYHQQDKALVYLMKNLEPSKKLSDKTVYAATLANIAKVYKEKDNIVEALSYYSKALKAFTELKNDLGISSCYNNLSVIYSQVHDWPKAMEYANASLELSKKIGDKGGEGFSYAQIGMLYINQDKYSEAKEYTFKSLLLRREIKSRSGTAGSLYDLGVIYGNLGMLDTALVLHKESNELAKALNDKSLICRNLSHIGMLYYKQGQKKLAVTTLEESKALAKELNLQENIRRSSLYLTQVYEDMGNTAKAFENYKQYIVARDSLNNSDIRHAVTKNQLQNEFDKKEIEAKAENRQKMIALTLEAEKKNARKNIWIVSLCAVLLLVVLSAYFVYNNIRQKNIIANQKASILKQKLLVSQMNPHFIFNSLSAIQNYIFSNDSHNAGTYLSRFADLMRMILEYSRRDLITLEEEINLLTIYFELQQLRFDFKFDYHILVSDSISPARVQLPPMLAQPFIENSIEHGMFYKEGKGNVTVNILKSHQMLVYEIEDDGVGLERSRELNSKTKTGHNSLATVITKERIDALGLKTGNQNRIDIIDLGKTQSHTGVKVRFEIPYLELN